MHGYNITRYVRARGGLREEILGDCHLTDEAQFDDKLSFPGIPAVGSGREMIRAEQRLGRRGVTSNGILLASELNS